MVLGSHLIDKEGTSHKMIGLLGLVTSYAKRKFNLGYRLAETNSPVEIFSANKKLRGHEFHYSSIIEQPDEPLFSVKDAEGNAVPTVFGISLHECLPDDLTGPNQQDQSSDGLPLPNTPSLNPIHCTNQTSKVNGATSP